MHSMYSLDQSSVQWINPCRTGTTFIQSYLSFLCHRIWLHLHKTAFLFDYIFFIHVIQQNPTKSNKILFNKMRSHWILIIFAIFQKNFPVFSVRKMGATFLKILGRGRFSRSPKEFKEAFGLFLFVEALRSFLD